MDAHILGVVGGAVLLAACTGPPDGGTERLPPVDGPTATATAGPPTTPPEQPELSEFLTGATDFVPSTHPGLLVVTPEGFAGVSDDGSVDRAGLVPPLPGDHEWKCLTEGGAGSAVCLGLSEPRRFEASAGPRCGEAELERHRVGRSVVTHRTYGPDGRLTQEITHQTYGEHYTLPGSDRNTEGGADVFIVDDLAADGTVRTRRVIGLESYQHTLDGMLIWANQGEIRIEDPAGAHEVTVVSGRWDRLQDPDGARERLCAVFG